MKRQTKLQFGILLCSIMLCGSINAQNQPANADIILMTETPQGEVFSYAGALYSLRSIPKVMKPCPEAYKTITQANKYYSAYYALALCAGGFAGATVGWLVGSLMRGTGLYDSDIFIMVSTGTLAIVSGMLTIAFRNKYQGKIHTAVKLFNRHAQQLTSEHNILLNIGLTGNGIGLRVTF